MRTLYNIYCDESCHLEKDLYKVMVLGAVWCELRDVKRMGRAIRGLKKRYGLNPSFEIKFTKVSPALIDFYTELVNFFFNEKCLHFRALIIPDKTKLNHALFGQTHDQWYYKMYFDMIKTILDPSDSYKIYVDIKDTCGGDKIRKLRDVLRNNFYDFNCDVIQEVQLIRSHESELMQLADLLIGIISYENRDLNNSPAKSNLVKLMKERSGYSLRRSTLLRENKVNLFCWQASEVGTCQ